MDKRNEKQRKREKSQLHGQYILYKAKPKAAIAAAAATARENIHKFIHSFSSASISCCKGT